MSGIMYARVTHVIDPHNFHAQIGDDEYFRLLSEYETWLDQHGKDLYRTKPEVIGVNSETNTGDFVLANSLTWGRWVRAQVGFVDTENGEVDVNCIDYGTTEMVRVESILRDEDDTDRRQAIAYQCSLAGVKPIANEWISRAVEFFSDLILGKKTWCDAIVQDPTTSVLLVDILIEHEGGKIQSVSEILHNEELALLERLKVGPGKSKVPDFDISRLHWKQSSNPPSSDEEEEEEEEDDLERDLFRKAVGATGDFHNYVPSDSTIGEGYQANVDSAALINLQDELRAMQEKAADGRGNGGVGWQNRSPKTRPLGRGRGIRKQNGSKEHKVPPSRISPRGSRGNIEPYCPPPPTEYHKTKDTHTSQLKIEDLPTKPTRGFKEHTREFVYDPEGNRQGTNSAKIMPKPERGFKEHSHDFVVNTEERKERTKSAKIASKPARNLKEVAHDFLEDSRESRGGAKPNKIPLKQAKSSTKMSSTNERKGRKPEQIPPEPIKSTKELILEYLAPKKIRQGTKCAESSSEMFSTNERMNDRERKEKMTRSSAKPATSSTSISANKSMINDYNWYRGKVERQYRKVLEKIDENSTVTEDVLQEMDQVIFPTTSKLEKLPGPKELHVCLELLMTNTVNKKTSLENATTIFERYKDNEMFPHIITQILTTFHEDIIKITTNTDTKRQRRPFCRLLGHLFIVAQRWDHLSSAPVIAFVTKVFDDWCLFNRDGEFSSPDKLIALYGACLKDLLPIAGGVLKEKWPAKFQEGFKELRAKIIDPQLKSETRQLLLDILIEHMVREKDQLNMSNVGSGKRDEGNQVNPRDLSLYKDVETETIKPPEVSTHSVHTQTGKVERSTDPYSNVIQMLKDINYEELIPLFKQNAIRDSLLDMEFADLKELLMEVGLKYGHIYEIKKYRDMKQRSVTSASQEAPSSEQYDESCYIRTIDHNSPNIGLNTTSYTHGLHSLPLHQPAPVLKPQPKYPNLLTPSSFEVSVPNPSNSKIISHLQMEAAREDIQSIHSDEGLLNKWGPTRADLDSNWRDRPKSTAGDYAGAFPGENPRVDYDPVVDDPVMVSNSGDVLRPRNRLTNRTVYGPRGKKEVIPGSDEFAD